jgi:hypothetical protein
METQREIEMWDGGYVEGYSAGYSRAIEEVQSHLHHEGQTEAADALAYLFSPEGIAEQNRKIKELYGSLAKLAAESRNAR